MRRCKDLSKYISFRTKQLINYWRCFLVEPGDELVGDGGAGVSLGDAVSAWAIAIGVSGDIGGNSVSSIKKGGVSLSAPLAKTLGGSGNEGSSGTGVGSDTGKTISVSVGVSSIGVGSGVSVSSVEESGISLSISRPLAVQVQVSRGGGGSNLSSQSIGGGQAIGVGVSSIGVGDTGVSVSSVKESGIGLSLGISGPLAIDIGSASVAGGLAVGGGHSGPVGVGIEQSRSVSQVSSVGLSRDGDSGASNNLR